MLFIPTLHVLWQSYQDIDGKAETTQFHLYLCIQQKLLISVIIFFVPLPSLLALMYFHAKSFDKLMVSNAACLFSQLLTQAFLSNLSRGNNNSARNALKKRELLSVSSWTLVWPTLQILRQEWDRITFVHYWKPLDKTDRITRSVHIITAAFSLFPFSFD